MDEASKAIGVCVRERGGGDGPLMDSPERNYSWSAEYRSLRRTRNVKRERETKIEGGEREKTRRERERNEGEGWKAARPMALRKLLKILVDFEQPDLSRVLVLPVAVHQLSCSFIHAFLVLPSLSTFAFFASLSSSTS